MTSHAAILDVDGTLVDSNDAHARAWVDAFGEAGLQVSYERVRRAIGMGGDKLMPHVSDLDEETEAGRRISERRGEIFRSRYLPHLRPFPGVRQLVERLAGDGFTVVVASSAKRDELEALLDIAGVADLISSRTSTDDAEHSKPDPDIIAAALKKSGAPPHAAIMLGDTPYDVEAAQRAGIAVVALESGGWIRDDLGGAAEVYADAAQLHERYTESVFYRTAARARHGRAARTSRVPIWWIAAPLLVAGLVIMAQAGFRRRSREDGPSEDAGDDSGAGRDTLTAQDREALRRIIERTS